jgi:hypothetical protein
MDTVEEEKKNLYRVVVKTVEEEADQMSFTRSHPDAQDH